MRRVAINKYRCFDGTRIHLILVFAYDMMFSNDKMFAYDVHLRQDVHQSHGIR